MQESSPALCQRRIPSDLMQRSTVSREQPSVSVSLKKAIIRIVSLNAMVPLTPLEFLKPLATTKSVGFNYSCSRVPGQDCPGKSDYCGQSIRAQEILSSNLGSLQQKSPCGYSPALNTSSHLSIAPYPAGKHTEKSRGD